LKQGRIDQNYVSFRADAGFALAAGFSNPYRIDGGPMNTRSTSISRRTSLIALAMSAALIPIAFQNCAEPLPDLAQYTSPSQSDAEALPLILSTSADLIDPSQNAQLTAEGGISPYTFAVTSGGGSVNSTGLFSPPNNAVTCVIEVTDAKGTKASKSISVVTSLTVSNTPSAPSVTDFVTVNAAGGSPPYAVTIISGTGTINGTTFSPAASPGSSNLRITDNTGQVRMLTITTTAPAITPVYRFDYNGEMFFSTKADGNGAVSFGYTARGQVFKLFTNQSPNTLPLYRCTYTPDPYYSYLSRTTACAVDFSLDGIAGYFSSAVRPNTSVLYGAAPTAVYAGYFSLNMTEISGFGTVTPVGYAPN